MMKKKAQLSIMDVPQLAIAILIIAITIGIMATILVSMQNASDGNDGWRTEASMTDVNDTFVVSNTTAVDIAGDHSSESNFKADSCTNVKVYNASNAADVTSNFTISLCTALLAVEGSAVHGQTLTANYTYVEYRYGASYNITDEGLDAQTDFSAWQSTWVVILAAAVVIGIISLYLFVRPRG